MLLAEIILGIACIIALLYAFISIPIQNRIAKKKNAEFRKRIECGSKINAKEFLAGFYPNDFEGAYVLHNLNNDFYYVGQSINVVHRVKQHFTGKGNGDVYADFKYNNEFEIIFVPLATSDYSD